MRLGASTPHELRAARMCPGATRRTERKSAKEVRESEGRRDKGEKEGKARLGKVGLGTPRKAERGSVGTGRAGWDRAVVKRKERPRESNKQKEWTRQETGVLRGHGAAKDCQGPHAVPMQQREGAQGRQGRG